MELSADAARALLLAATVTLLILVVLWVMGKLSAAVAAANTARGRRASATD